MRNAPSVADYCERTGAGEKPVENSETLTDGQILLERLYFGFRTRDGLPIGFFDFVPGGAEVLAELERTALLRIEKDRAIPTRRGYLLSDRLPLLFDAS